MQDRDSGLLDFNELPPPPRCPANLELFLMPRAIRENIPKVNQQVGRVNELGVDLRRNQTYYMEEVPGIS
jgi:hypothetical protein